MGVTNGGGGGDKREVEGGEGELGMKERALMLFIP